ncbi:hypothetical protein PCH_Pc12g05060 [Penicillium rubens Wisconsin 54-1255]|uniref:Uncharacterized protein n=1 Tax=Penicillium rubens (strain ATCC 28089 / DSM 1075 / NRRL 1951 / Wisconsin 54-1255) TaxID=500485 RepID=B6GYU0_PENRW|nr:hypothetical protein PCH_Pc12g05060 [Penicillium rubens Wisconsin 54-1255]
MAKADGKCLWNSMEVESPGKTGSNGRMSQFDEEGNGPSSENGPNGDKKDKVEKKRGREKGKLKGILETVSQFGAEGVMINCGVALNGDSEFLQGSHETNGLTVKGLVGHQSAKGGGGEGI